MSSVVGLLVGVLAILLAQPQQAPAAVAAVSGTRTTAGYPRWYSDEAGVRLEACLDPNDPNCVVLPNPGVYDPAQPTVFPTNFPDEAFYLLAESDPIPTPGCAGTRPGEAFAVLGLEQAFSTGDPMPGAQQVFGRVRIVADGLCANTPYTFTHPYGQVTLTTEADGSLTKPGGTVDIGCAAVTVPCDFAEALSSPVLKSFLRWDPAVAPAADPGYLGDPNVLHPIVGATFNPGTGPANYFQVQGAGIPVLRTNLFSLFGKIAGPLHSTPETVDGGNQPINIPSDPRDVVLTNVSPAALTVTGAEITPAGSPFTLLTNNCTTLAVDASCTVTVRFAPTVTGPVTASLVVSHGSFRSPTVVPLVGAGTTAVTPNVSSAPAALEFGRVLTGSRGIPMGVVVTNSGPGTFAISGVSVVDSAAGQAGDSAAFLPIAANDCPATGLLAGTSCTVTIAFTPGAQRPYRATLQIVGTVGANPITRTAELSGRGGLAVSSMGADGVGPDGTGVGGFPAWYQDDRGVRLSQCLAATDPNCVVAADAGFNPAAPVVFPTNYPGEAFYYLAESERMTTPGCGAASPPGIAGFRAATEQTFASGSPVAGEQMVFGRVRLFVTSGLCPGQSYTFVHPYGTFSFVADELGGLKRPAGTTDIGCFPSPTTPCNFNFAVWGPVSDGYLRWDTTVPAPPAGYLGDAATLHTIAGAPYIEPGASTAANYVKLLDSTNALVVTTDRFTVMGKIDPTQTATRFQTVAPAAIAFGDANVGITTPARTITVESVGTTPLTVTGATLAGADAADFVIASNTCATQAVGSRCTITVSFRPTTPGARTATLNIASNAANAFNGSIPLTGTGLASALPVLSVTPTAVNFPNQLAGTTSPAQTVTVTNAGGAPLTITAKTLGGTNPGDFAVAGCTVALNPGVSCTLTLNFAPPVTGARAATLDLVSNGGNATITLNGTGVAPVLSVTPTTLTYAAQAVASTSAAQTVTVTNSGTSPLSLTAVTVGGLNGADFLATNGCTAAVAPTGTCTISVGFRPAAIGARTATLTIGSNGGTATVALTGTGVAAAAPIMTVAPTTIDFGGIAPGNFTAPRTVTVTNTGTANLTVTGASAAPLAGGASYRVVNNCTVAVVPGGTCTITVAFEPGSVGTKTGTLALSSNGGNATVALTGFGALPAISVIPTTVTFAAQGKGVTSAAQTVTVSNPGTAPLSVTGATLAGANAADFRATNNCATPVAPAGTCTISVSFVPTTIGSRTATLNIASNAGPATLVLSGSGIPAGPCPVSVTGWWGQYFPNNNVTGTPTVCRNEAAVNFNWGFGSPAAGIPLDNFSARWSRVQNFAAGTYTFSAAADDGVRLYIDGVLVINDWVTAGGGTRTANVALTAGDHVIEMEHREGIGLASASLSWVVVPGATCPATINGWKGEYWSNITLAGAPLLCRDDAALSFDWGLGSPAPTINSSTFSARWTRTVNFAAGTYTFSAGADDAVRVYVDGNLVINSWINSTYTVRTANVSLAAGNHTIVMEFYENGGNARANLSWVAIPGATCPATINGWKGEYWSNITFTGAPVLCRDDAAINFNWGLGSPAANISVSTFSARWTRTVNFTAGTYTFSAGADDAVRLYVDGQKVLDSWINGTYSVRTVDVALTAGNHTIVMEFYENGSNARADLGWVAKASPSGLLSSWFPNLTFTGTPSVQRVQPPSLAVAAGASPITGFPSSGWSVQFTGSLVPTATGNTVIRVANATNDQVRVYVNNVLVIDNWVQPSLATKQGTVALTANAAVPIRVEFADPFDVANLAVSWQLPGTTTFATIPVTQFRPL